MTQLEKYFNYRQFLIDVYVKGDINKKEYLKRNLDAVLSVRDEPFKNVDSLEKGIYNYQFYNALAKDSAMEAKTFSKKDYVDIYQERTNYYYSMKDHTTMQILRFLDYTDVEAYMIKVRSRFLKNKLFEIVLTENKIILHSTSEVIKNRLIEENCFKEGVKTSLIDEYINHKY